MANRDVSTAAAKSAIVFRFKLISNFILKPRGSVGKICNYENSGRSLRRKAEKLPGAEKGASQFLDGSKSGEVRAGSATIQENSTSRSHERMRKQYSSMASW